MSTTFETAYLAMLAADVAGEDPTPHIRECTRIAELSDPTGTGTAAQRNAALIAGRNPPTPGERNAALVGRRGAS